MKIFYPDLDYPNVREIPFEQLRKQGIRVLIFDLDNTLTRHDAPACAEDVSFFAHLRDLGFETLILSNNKEKRVGDFARAVSSPYICEAGKPRRKNYLQALARLRAEKKEAAFVGDQLFTDIWGAKRSGILSILVQPLHKSEEIQITLKRNLEKLILYFYRKNKKRG